MEAPAGKEAYLQKTADLLKAPGNYGELSGAIGNIMIKYHQVPFVDNEQRRKKSFRKRYRVGWKTPRWEVSWL